MIDMQSATYQGMVGSYSECAVKQLGYRPIPCPTFVDCVNRVQDGGADLAIIPIENSTEGSVGAAIDVLHTTNLKITGEMYYHVRHCLIGNGSLDMIREVYSHPQALGQCSRYIGGLKQIPVHDTAAAVKLIYDMERTDVAAIASREAAGLYGMQIIDEDINDVYENYTHFLQLGYNVPKQTEHSKTTIHFTLQHIPGALQSALHALRMLNLTRIESRPIKNGYFEYIFSLDFIGHKCDENVKDALGELENNAASLAVLGSYELNMDYPTGGARPK